MQKIKKKLYYSIKCDHEGCLKKGEYKAPKNKSLTDFYWFCLDHVRQYNKKWNYYEGYTEKELEESIRSDTIWQRTTRKFGASVLEKKPFHLPRNVEEAMVILDLNFPYTKKELKLKYKYLAKKYHPDINFGNKDSEEKFKKLTQNYKILLEFL